jgi:hypothetical protein
VVSLFGRREGELPPGQPGQDLPAGELEAQLGQLGDDLVGQLAAVALLATRTTSSASSRLRAGAAMAMLTCKREKKSHASCWRANHSLGR